MHRPHVRAATADDLSGVDVLNVAAVPAVNDIGMNGFGFFAATAPYFRVVDDADGGIAAFLVGLDHTTDGYDSINFAWFAARYPRFCYVDRVVVAAHSRSRGLGTLLYADFEAFAVGQGVPLVACEVNIVPRNDISLAFHAARGYAAVGEQDTEGGTKRVRLMTKDLNRSA